MTKNEIVARWTGYSFDQYGKVLFGGYWTPIDKLPNKFLEDYNLLNKAWVKFRDLNFDGKWQLSFEHKSRVDRIGILILTGTITEAFDELVKGIEWYINLNIKQ